MMSADHPASDQKMTDIQRGGLTTLGKAAFHQPSQDNYQALIFGLARARTAMVASSDALDGTFGGLVAVLNYLRANPHAEAAGLLDPLEKLARAVWDVSQGGKPSLFFGAHRKGGAPKNQLKTAAGGILAALVKLLMESGESLGDAINIVASEARRLGIRSNGGEPVSNKRVEEWYYETDKRGDNLRGLMFRAIMERHAEGFKEALRASSKSSIAVRTILADVNLTLISD